MKRLISHLVKRKYSDSSKVLIEYKNDTCLMTLNNPKVFNALDTDMFEIMETVFNQWENSQRYPQNLIVKSAHPKAFCAGGDVKGLLFLKQDNAPFEELVHFFKKEFEFDYKMAKLKEKGVNTFAFWNGIVMGGGVGLTTGFSHRIATHKTLFAMPETRIGLFVDVACSYHLNKIDRAIGRHLAILGHRLKGPQVFWAGIANHFITEDSLDILEQKIISNDHSGVKDLLKSYSFTGVQDLGSWLAYLLFCHEFVDLLQNKTENIYKVYDQMESSLANKLFLGKISEEHKRLIETMQLNMNEVVQKIKTEQIALLKTGKEALAINSPLSTLITDRNFLRSGESTLRDVFLKDFELVKNVFKMEEVFIGIDNLLVKKGKEQPVWTYKNIEQIPNKVIDTIMNSSDDTIKLNLID